MENLYAAQGGPAFAAGNHEQGGDPGMTLRDYYAGQALIGCLTQCSGHQELMLDGRGYTNLSDIALGLFRIADAMLKARESSAVLQPERDQPQ